MEKISDPYVQSPQHKLLSMRINACDVPLVAILIVLLLSNYCASQEIDLAEQNLRLQEIQRNRSGFQYGGVTFWQKKLNELAPRKIRTPGHYVLNYEEYQVYRRPIVAPQGQVFFPTRDTLRQWDLHLGRETRRFPFEIGFDSRGQDWLVIPDPQRGRLITTRASSPTTTSPLDSDVGAPIVVWSLDTGERIQEHSMRRGNEVYNWALSPGGRRLICGIRQRTHYRLTSLDFSRNEFDEFSIQASHPNARVSYSNYANLGFAMVFLEDGILATITEEDRKGKYLNIYEKDGSLKNAKQITTGRGRSATIASSPTGKYLATVHQEDSLSDVAILWDAETLYQLRRWSFPVGANTYANLRASFSQDDRRLLVSVRGTGYARSVVLDIDSGRCLGGLAIDEAAFVPNTDLIIGIRGRERTVQLWSASTFGPVAELIPMSAERHWAIKTWQGYFAASERVLELIKQNNDLLSTERDVDIVERYYRPRLVRLLLQGVSPNVVERLPEEYQRPEATLRLVSASQGGATVAISAQSHGSGVSIKEFKLDRHDRPLPPSVVAETGTVDSLQVAVEKTITVPFPPGKNRMTLEAFATDSFGVASRPKLLTIDRPERVEELSGRLFLLAVGVSEHEFSEYNLRYPATDAHALEEQLVKQEGMAFAEVHKQSYTDKKASLTNVRNGLSWLQRSCTADDVAVIFFAGHGIKGRRGLYYVTHEGDDQAIQYTCLNWEEVAEAISKVRARQVIFLSDVCHAGGFAQSDLAMQGKMVKQIAEIDGVLVFAASGADELAFEDPEWQHGAFTSALLSSLSGEADRNSDGAISLRELIAHTTEQTQQLTAGKQTPFVGSTATYHEDLILARVLKRDAETDALEQLGLPEEASQ